MKNWQKSVSSAGLEPTKPVRPKRIANTNGGLVGDSVPPISSYAREGGRRRPDTELLALVMQQIGESGGESVRTIEIAPEPSPPPAAGGDPAWTLPGFGGKCRVTTIFGELPIEALRLRDRVKTITGAFREVEWIDAVRLDEEFMDRHPEAQPIMIGQKALAGLYPSRNMLVSPGQEVWSPAIIGQNRPKTVADFGHQPNFQKSRKPGFTYYRFHCGAPETICIENAWFCVAP